MVVSAQKKPSLHLRPVPLCVITTLTFITTDFFCLLKTAQRSRYKIYGYSKSMIRNTLFLLTSTKQNPSYFWSIYLCTAVWLVLSFIIFESINTPSVFVHCIGAREVDCYQILAAENDAVVSKWFGDCTYVCFSVVYIRMGELWSMEEKYVQLH